MRRKVGRPSSIMITRRTIHHRRRLTVNASKKIKLSIFPRPGPRRYQSYYAPFRSLRQRSYWEPREARRNWITTRVPTNHSYVFCCLRRRRRRAGTPLANKARLCLPRAALCIEWITAKLRHMCSLLRRFWNCCRRCCHLVSPPRGAASGIRARWQHCRSCMRR